MINILFRHGLILLALLAAACASAFAQSVKDLQRDAKHGDPGAQYKLAEAYFQGQGVAQDAREGMRWLQDSAEKNPQAQFKLGEIYRDGTIGVTKDERAALDLFLKAAQQGNLAAQVTLGLIYKAGTVGARRDPHEAARWFRLAARQNNPDAQANLSQMEKAGQITKQEANWQAPETAQSTATAGNTTAGTAAKPFTFDELQKGLRGGITNKRLISLVKQYGVDFTVTPSARTKLAGLGADDALLAAISKAKQ